METSTKEQNNFQVFLLRNADSLGQLFEDLVNQVNADDNKAIEQTESKIKEMIVELETIEEIDNIVLSTTAIKAKLFPKSKAGEKFKLADYESLAVFLNLAVQSAIEMQVAIFMRKWGLVKHTTAKELIEIFRTCNKANQGLGISDRLAEILTAASHTYKDIIDTDSEIKELSRIKYRNALWSQFNDLASEIKPFI